MGYKLTGMYIGSQKVRPTGIPTDNLLGYYPLQSDVNDVSGNGNNGTIIGTVNYGTISGYSGALFARGNNKISVPITVSQTPVTICCWAYCTGITDWATLIGNPSSDQPDGYAIRFHSEQTNDHAIIIDNGSSADRKLGDNTYSDNVWFNIIMVVEQGSTNIYINGNKTTIPSGGDASGITNFYIASFGTGKSYFGWNGYIRDVAIYNKAFADAEVSQYITATS